MIGEKHSLKCTRYVSMRWICNLEKQKRANLSKNNDSHFHSHRTELFDLLYPYEHLLKQEMGLYMKIWKWFLHSMNIKIISKITDS